MDAQAEPCSLLLLYHAIYLEHLLRRLDTPGDFAGMFKGKLFLETGSGFPSF